jgi:PPOX class probable F420-dependent enzyme
MLDSRLREFATSKNFAAFTTIMPDGMPQTSVMWIDADEEFVLIATEASRQKARNVRANPKVSLVIWRAENPYEYVEVRGVVEGEVTREAALAQLDALSHRYTGQPYAIDGERIVLQIRPTRVRFNA